MSMLGSKSKYFSTRGPWMLLQFRISLWNSNLIFLTEFFSRPIIWKFECIMVDDVILCAKFQNDWTSGINHWWMTFHIVAVNSLWPRDTIWRHGSGSKLAQVMACCLMAPSHFLNQCWLIISEVWWHFSEDNFTIDASEDSSTGI